MAKVFKDYCGILTEEAIRKNFILIYELLDEMIDGGYPQTTSTENLKSFVHNEAIPTVPSTSTLGSLVNTSNSSFMSSIRTKSSSSTNVPINSTLSNASSKLFSNKNEIYVDIIEKLTVVFNSSGQIINNNIDGSIIMKSFLSGNPELRLALNDDLIIGKNNYNGSASASSYSSASSGPIGPVVLDDCIFHECVHLDEFESSRTLHFLPPEGEFSVLNYRITREFKPPIYIRTSIEELNEYKLEISVYLRIDIPEGQAASNVIIKMPVPRSTSNATVEFYNPQLYHSSNSVSSSSYSSVSSAATSGVNLQAPIQIPGSNTEYMINEKNVLWTLKKVQGNSDYYLKARISLENPITSLIKREIGPVSLNFEVPMYNVSGLQVRYLRISETHKAYNPCRWVRYIVQSASYVCRV